MRLSKELFEEQKTLLAACDDLKERIASLLAEQNQHIKKLDKLQEPIEDHC